MNILFINDIPFNPKYGGIERVTDVLTKQLIDSYGHKIYYLSFQDREELDYVYPAKLYVLPRSSGLEDQKRYLLDIIDRHYIDVVVNQRGQFKSICDIIPRQKTKVVNVIHSQPTAWIKMRLLLLYNYTPQTISLKIRYAIKVLLYPLVYCYWKHKESKNFSSHYRFILNNYDALVLLSDKYRDELIRLTGSKIPLSKIIGIPNPNTFEGANCEWSSKEKVILYVGRLDKIEKAPLRLIKIWKRLYRKYPDWRLVLVGGGEYMSHMSEYVNRKSIDRVYFEGRQSNVAPYYEKASFICLTSNYEGWGMVLTEGMQYGCIPFTFNNYGAASDIIDDDVSGCLISPFNYNEYARRLSKLMDDDVLREKMSLETQKKVKEFDANKISMMWDELFRSL